MYGDMYTIIDASSDGLSYREAYDMPVDKLELHIYLNNARTERTLETAKLNSK